MLFFLTEAQKGLFNSLLTYRSFEGGMEPVAGTLSVSDTSATREDAERVKGDNCTQVFQRLRKQMQPRGMREKLKVDPEDQVMDVYSYYKSSNFDASIPISVLVKGQPAIDTGGVLRQVYSEVFLSMCNNEGIKHIFTGEQFRKVPVFQQRACIFCQGGPGFPYLSPAVYWYLATGDLQVALAKASCADVSNKELLKYIDKISDAQDSDLAAVVFESEFIQLMCEAGEVRVVTAGNKLDVTAVTDAA
ncbi:hypothetical protein OS493_036905 [Desmophyllum pertusum]|uniref:Uncharacterized protein n=1 Tax=Desmophyllum pertusum TaxID=174260 RepID=A0A9X0CDM9_9CNID|nr:hypothetical protein OS493_036905 [Desmophyllum pertusum]